MPVPSPSSRDHGGPDVRTVGFVANARITRFVLRDVRALERYEEILHRAAEGSAACILDGVWMHRLLDLARQWRLMGRIWRGGFGEVG